MDLTTLVRHLDETRPELVEGDPGLSPLDSTVVSAAPAVTFAAAFLVGAGAGIGALAGGISFGG
ncbi:MULTISPECIES: hypothetical protein [unclassified Streptomyces]|uniref:hypothetical protein n=1 Tax=unclassified Streptomyces TaxID=2593676 RepID=UPI001905180F|nr:hypothetical protein [Streptomyces sp. HSG2]